MGLDRVAEAETLGTLPLIPTTPWRQVQGNCCYWYGVGRGCELSQSLAGGLDVSKETEHDPGWWQLAYSPEQRSLLLPGDQRMRGKVRAGGCLCIDITQDRSQGVSLTSNLTPVKAECPVTVQ